MSGPGELTVQVQAPTMVFLSGVLLPVGTYRIEHNPVSPNIVDVTVLRDAPHLPRVLRDLFASIALSGAVELPAELKGGRVFMSMPGPGGAALFVELGLRNLLLVQSKPQAPA